MTKDRYTDDEIEKELSSFWSFSPLKRLKENRKASVIVTREDGNRYAVYTILVNRWGRGYNIPGAYPKHGTVCYALQGTK